MKRPVSGASLPLRHAVWDDSEPAKIVYLEPAKIAYTELMGKDPPASESPQWDYTGRKRADKEILAQAIVRE